jgi:hypothetical protein
MLWVDTLFVQTSDLMVIDPEVADVAGVECITVDGPDGICAETISECLSEVMKLMQRFGGYLSSGLVSANHMAAVMNVGGPGVNRVRITPDQIVVRQTNIPQVDSVRRWVVYRCLYNIFRAAASRTADERFRTKRNDYLRDVQRRYRPLMLSNGLPVVFRPFPCPGAPLERYAGVWGADNVTLASHIGLAGGTFDVAITWVDQSFYHGPQYGGLLNLKGNAESCTSIPVTQVVPTNEALSVNLAGLMPPVANEDPAYVALALTTSLNASGFNVYVGNPGGPLYLQNSFPVPVSTGVYTLPGDPVLSGYVSDLGQYPDCYYTMNQNLIQRG